MKRVIVIAQVPEDIQGQHPNALKNQMALTVENYGATVVHAQVYDPRDPISGKLDAATGKAP